MLSRIIDSISNPFKTDKTTTQKIIKESKALTWGDVFNSVERTSGGPVEFANLNMKIDAQVYGSLPWAGIALNRVIKDCSCAKFLFYDTKTLKIIEPSKLDKRLFNIFYTKQQGLTFEDILVCVIGNLKLSGNAFILKKEKTGISLVRGGYDSIEIYPTQYVDIQMKTSGYGISHYSINGLGENKQSISTHSIVHFKQNAIFNPFVGLGDSAAIRLFSRTNESMNAAARVYAETGGLPSMIIRKDPMGQSYDELERESMLLRAQFDKGKALGTTKIISAEEIIFPKFNPSDMGYSEAQEYETKVTTSAFGVPQSVLGIGASNYATMHIEKILYLENTCNNLLTNLENTINSSLVSDFDTTIRFKFEKYNTSEQKSVIDQLNSGIITYNRAAEILGQPVDSGNPDRDSYKV